MIRFYSIFVTNSELLSSPYIRQFSSEHDLTLRTGEVEVVNFLLQYHIPTELHRELSVMYEPGLIDLTKAQVETFHNQTIITLEIIASEMGTAEIGFAFPEKEHAGKLQRMATSYQNAVRSVITPLTLTRKKLSGSR